jgi:hypothetical protein
VQLWKWTSIGTSPEKLLRVMIPLIVLALFVHDLSLVSTSRIAGLVCTTYLRLLILLGIATALVQLLQQSLASSLRSSVGFRQLSRVQE